MNYDDVKDQSILFAKWICKKRFIPSIIDNNWYMNYTDELVYYTTDELYNLYLKSIQL